MSEAQFQAEACFRAGGALAQELADYLPRAEQDAMAQAVWEAMQQERTLVVEAGTGVGKTLAYLMPALAFGRKTLIATGTRHLQDQLFNKDLPPAMRAACESGAVTPRACLLKGRANYLCRHRYQIYQADLLAQSKNPRIQPLQEWAGRTRSGDLAEFDCPEDDDMIPAITSTQENCLGKKCPEYDDCFVVRARERAQRSRVVVANHHLFAADLALREDSLGQLLPDFDVLILDEAHRLTDVLEQFWSRRLGTSGIWLLCQEIEKAARPDAETFEDLLALVRQARKTLREVIAEVREFAGPAGLAEQLAPPDGIAESLQPLIEALQELRQELQERQDDGPDFENFGARCAAFIEGLEGWPSGAENFCEYLSVTDRNFSLHRVPIDISELFAQARTRYPPRWVFTSATLSVDKTFDYFQQTLGLGAETDTLRLESPFDFRSQTQLYLPPGLPDPRADNYTPAMLEAVLPLLEQLRGKTFLLFTSLRAMEQAGQWLQGRLDVPLLTQGDSSKQKLLQQFLARPSVLLGSMAFWEGVDIPGAPLSCVVIDKIPFMPHTDLLYRAREQAVKARDENPFQQLQLPRAALLLKQGVGRLIRGVSDRGVAVIADPRMQSKNYGRVLRDSLPAMPVQTKLPAVLEFLQERAA